MLILIYGPTGIQESYRSAADLFIRFERTNSAQINDEARSTKSLFVTAYLLGTNELFGKRNINALTDQKYLNSVNFCIAASLSFSRSVCVRACVCHSLMVSVWIETFTLGHTCLMNYDGNRTNTCLKTDTLECY